MIVEQPIEPGFKLVQPEKARETTPDRHRFQVEVPAGKTASLKVVTERPVSELITLREADLELVTAYSQSGQAGEKLRAALKDLLARRRKITDLQAQRATLDAEIKSIGEEQTRIRQNMAQLDRNSALYQQYVKKFSDQETRIERVREEIARLREAEGAAQKELKEFLDGLSIE